MSYTAHTWSTGETITADKMNNIEQGIADMGSGAMIVHFTLGENTLDKTYREIYNAIISGVPVFMSYIYGAPDGQTYTCLQRLVPITTTYLYDSSYRVAATYTRVNGSVSGKTFTFSPSVMIFSATDLDDYPSFLTTIGSTTVANSITGDSYSG